MKNNLVEGGFPLRKSTNSKNKLREGGFPLRKSTKRTTNWGREGSPYENQKQIGGGRVLPTKIDKQSKTNWGREGSPYGEEGFPLRKSTKKKNKLGEGGFPLRKSTKKQKQIGGGRVPPTKIDKKAKTNWGREGSPYENRQKAKTNWGSNLSAGAAGGPGQGSKGFGQCFIYVSEPEPQPCDYWWVWLFPCCPVVPVFSFFGKGSDSFKVNQPTKGCPFFPWLLGI